MRHRAVTLGTDAVVLHLTLFFVSACHLKITHWGSVKVCWKFWVQHKKSKACVTAVLWDFCLRRAN